MDSYAAAAGVLRIAFFGALLRMIRPWPYLMVVGDAIRWKGIGIGEQGGLRLVGYPEAYILTIIVQPRVGVKHRI